MQKLILITGSTDGIGLEAAKMLAKSGHAILLHGRSSEKLENAKSIISDLSLDKEAEGYIADLSNLEDVRALAHKIVDKYGHMDVLINNAGIYKTPQPLTVNGHDIRFIVNTIAPYLLTRLLLPIMDASSRVINLSSAAQAPVDIAALIGNRGNLDHMSAYSQSKLAILMWSRHLANTLGGDAPIIIPVNPGSLLASKMVKEGFGVEGNDLSIGAEILMRLSLDKEFEDKSGQYFDNDKGAFGSPHPEALNEHKCAEIVEAIENLIT
ncbi:MAG: oxidoreductase [Alphaproteobacteria bacterium]|nr:oxidoreductase [Alphaproteobacteria bacterium]|tara:strand:+ start:2172 stop:2972 length:801 start_codon:yes stop_codon:yes gene_type:complete